jgi:hypothetical protein
VVLEVLLLRVGLLEPTLVQLLASRHGQRELALHQQEQEEEELLVVLPQL